MGCALCPRRCGAERESNPGFCGGGSLVRVARAAPHFWEEPCISGTRGSGTVFFSGCALKCVFCQNQRISSGNYGREVTSAQLADIFLRLQDQGVHNINLVTPTHYTEQILKALSLARLSVPVVMNCGGYECVETLRMWEGYIDVYLPDLKYYDPALSKRYSGAADYFMQASAAILEMHRQQPVPVFDGDLMQRGLIVRHLVLPGASADSLSLLDWLDGALPKESFYLSLMRQFTPTKDCAAYPELNRRLTTFEYERAAKRAAERGFQGFLQDKSSADSEYTPNFDLTGII